MSLDRRQLACLMAGGAASAFGARWGETMLPLRPGERVDPDAMPMVEASWYKKIGEKKIECELCPQACTVADMERGMCGARENRGGTYHTLVHSMACAIHVDPIEKKPFFHVMPGEKALSYATAGCNVECKFCQNWEISQFRPEQVEAQFVPPSAIVNLAKRGGARLIAATYSEPVIFWEYVRDAAVAAREGGLEPTVVSNGFIKQKPLKDVLPHLSAFKVDLKAFSESFYREQVRGALEPVLKSLETIRESGVWLEVVVLLIPGLNDGQTEIRRLAKWVYSSLGADVPVHFTRFHPTYRLKNLPPTPVPTLEMAWTTAREAGLNFVYLGNVPGHPGENTVCPGCESVLIRRIGFRILDNRLHNGACPSCSRPIPGFWGLGG